jgi:calcineurin-like phosphoesterase family protein
MDSSHHYKILSDTHLRHTRIIEYGRPQNFEELLISGFKTINPSEILVHLGDICIGQDKIVHDDIIQKINCFKKILVLGNHDNKSMTWYYDNGWDCVCRSLSIKYNDKRILFTHAPKKQSESFDLNIHGHLHTMERPERIDEFGSVYNPEYHKLISMEYSKYLPISLDKIISNKG